MGLLIKSLTVRRSVWSRQFVNPHLLMAVRCAAAAIQISTAGGEEQ